MSEEKQKPKTAKDMTRVNGTNGNTSAAICGFDDAHRLRGVRQPSHHQRDCKLSVPEW